MSEPSVKNVPTSVSTPAEICDKEIANELQNLREELDRFYQNGKSSDLNAVRRAFGASPKVNQESRVDWRTNHIILNCIFSHLPVAALKFARLVCKQWTQEAAPALAKKSVMTNKSSVIVKRIKGLGRRHLEEFVKQQDDTVWDSRFQIHHLELFSLSVNISTPISPHFSDWIKIDQFRHLVSFRLELNPPKLAFQLWLTYWLPTHWRKLKTLKLFGFAGRLDSPPLDLPIEDPPKNDCDLEQLLLGFYIDEISNGKSWTFLRNCPKLKYLDLRAMAPVFFDRTVQERTQPQEEFSKLEPFQRTILEALKPLQLETLKLTMYTPHLTNQPISCSWRLFVQRVVNTQSRSLKRFFLSLSLVRYVAEDLRTVAAMLTIPPSVEHFSFKVEWEPEHHNEYNLQLLFEHFLPAIYRQWTANLKRLQFKFNADRLLPGKLVMTSSTDLLCQWYQSKWEMNFNRNSAHQPVQTTLQTLFPKVNYVCCTLQRLTDSGLSCTTYLFERFGKEDVFNLPQVFADWDDPFEQQLGFEGPGIRNSKGDTGEFSIFEPHLIREVAVKAERWSDADFRGVNGHVFVFGHLSQSDMEEAWVKVQRSVRFCSSTSVQEEFTPEVVKSGQGSYAFHRIFTTLIGETFEEMCQRFS